MTSGPGIEPRPHWSVEGECSHNCADTDNICINFTDKGPENQPPFVQTCIRNMYNMYSKRDKLAGQLNNSRYSSIERKKSISAHPGVQNYNDSRNMWVWTPQSFELKKQGTRNLPVVNIDKPTKKIKGTQSSRSCCFYKRLYGNSAIAFKRIKIENTSEFPTLSLWLVIVCS